MWCMFSRITWSAASRRISRHPDHRTRWPGRTVDGSPLGGCLARGPRATPRAQPGDRRAACPLRCSVSTWTGRPSIIGKTACRMSCRWTMSWSAATSASTFSGPRMRTAAGTLYAALSGASRCRNHIRSWAKDSGAGRRPSRARWRRDRPAAGRVPSGDEEPLLRHRGRLEHVAHAEVRAELLRTRDTTWVASDEWPPSAKKSSSIPTWPRPSTCAQIPARPRPPSAVRGRARTLPGASGVRAHRRRLAIHLAVGGRGRASRTAMPVAATDTAMAPGQEDAAAPPPSAAPRSPRHEERAQGGPATAVGAHHRGGADRRMRRQGRLDVRRTDAVPTNLWRGRAAEVLEPPVPPYRAEVARAVSPFARRPRVGRQGRPASPAGRRPSARGSPVPDPDLTRHRLRHGSARASRTITRAPGIGHPTVRVASGSTRPSAAPAPDPQARRGSRPPPPASATRRPAPGSAALRC